MTRTWPMPTSLMSIRSKARRTRRSHSSAQAIALKPDWAPLYRGRAECSRIGPIRRPRIAQAAQADLKLAIRYEKPDNPVLALDHTNRGKLLYRRRAIRRRPRGEPGSPCESPPTIVDAQVLQVQSLAQVEALRRGDPRVRHRPRQWARNPPFSTSSAAWPRPSAMTTPAQSGISARPWRFAPRRRHCWPIAAGRT